MGHQDSHVAPPPPSPSPTIAYQQTCSPPSPRPPPRAGAQTLSSEIV